MAWSVSTGYNNIKRFVVGIVSSTGADANTDYTWEKEIEAKVDGVWYECSVTFNLPEIINANPGKSFNDCAIFIGLVPEIDASTEKTTRCLLNIDDVSLTAVE